MDFGMYTQVAKMFIITWSTISNVYPIVYYSDVIVFSNINIIYKQLCDKVRIVWEFSIESFEG